MSSRTFVFSSFPLELRGGRARRPTFGNESTGGAFLSTPAERGVRSWERGRPARIFFERAGRPRSQDASLLHGPVRGLPRDGGMEHPRHRRGVVHECGGCGGSASHTVPARSGARGGADDEGCEAPGHCHRAPGLSGPMSYLLPCGSRPTGTLSFAVRATAWGPSVLLLSSLWPSSRPLRSGLVFQTWRRSATATPSGLGPGASGSTASTSLESEQCCRAGGETWASAAAAIRALREWTAGRPGALAGLDLWLLGGEYRNAERAQGG